MQINAMLQFNVHLFSEEIMDLGHHLNRSAFLRFDLNHKYLFFPANEKSFCTIGLPRRRQNPPFNFLKKALMSTDQFFPWHISSARVNDTLYTENFEEQSSLLPLSATFADPRYALVNSNGSVVLKDKSM